MNEPTTSEGGLPSLNFAKLHGHDGEHLSMHNYLTPYDTGRRAEPRVWPVATPELLQGVGPMGRRLEELRFGKVDFNDGNGEILFTVWVERNERGHHVVNIMQAGETPVAIEVHP